MTETWLWTLNNTNVYIALAVFLFAQIFMVHTLYESTRSPFQIVMVWLIYYTVVFGIVYFLEASLTFISVGTLAIFASYTGLLAHLILFPKIPVMQNCFTFFFTTSIIYVCILSARTIVALFGRMVTPEGANRLFWTAYLVIIVFFLITFFVETKFAIWAALRVYRERLLNLLIYSVLQCVVLIVVTDALGPWLLPDWGTKVVANILFIAVCVSGYLLAFNVLVNIGKQLEAEAESIVSQKQLNSSAQYYTTLAENIKNVRVHNHNMKYIVSAMAGLAEQGDLEGMKDFIGKVQIDMPKNFPVWSRVPEIDAIFATAADVCSKEGISFNCEYTLPHNNGIEPIHMCTMLGNAIRNATDACLKMSKESERCVAVQCFPIMDKIVICVENSYDGNLKKRPDGSLSTTKEYEEFHGYGMESIQTTAERYHGNTTWDTSETEDEAGNKQYKFKLNILLTRPE